DEASLSTLTPTELKVFAALSFAPAPVDDVAARAEVAVPDALSALFALELAGRVEQWPGGLFARASPARR
ncbi:MAG TPA: hypothetical protein VFU03_07300, partial [Gemmatimonadales bacterium]|nr:hypothetical protein [Gemmatimonadales bacterium]